MKQQQTQTVFHSESSILNSPPPSSSIMLHPTNTFHLFQYHNMNMSACNPTSLIEAHSNPITTLFYGILIPSDAGSSLGGFLIDHSHHPVLEPNKTMIDDASPKTMVLAPQPSSSVSSLPFSVLNQCGLVMNESHSDTNQEVNEKKDTNFANQNIIKRQWTPEEDCSLVELVNQFGTKNWSKIARLMQSRTGKQCRERWNNHLQPNIRKESWSQEEDMILIKAHQEFGTKWSKIAKRLSGRTENAIKNHWHATMRRQHCKKCNKNKDGPYEGSMLHAYVKWVSATEGSAKKSTNQKNKKVLRCNCDELALLLS